MAYDHLLADRLDGQTTERRSALYRETLKDKPWKRCLCAMCRELGVEVIIFRGNNRNRRRGFHNLWVVRQRLNRLSGSLVPPQASRRKARRVLAGNFHLPLVFS
jgi:hypothetical protein